MKYVIFLIVIASGCTAYNQTSENGSDMIQKEVHHDYEQLPEVGFNLKASLVIDEQIRYTDTLFSKFNKGVLEHMILRIPGGARSQKEYSEDWSDEMMKLWIGLQKKYGFSFMFVVNGNDSPANQLRVIRRWISNGAKIESLELMSEYYLPKFSQPKLEKPEVTKRVDVEMYTEEILPDYYPYLDSLNLPYYLIFAPAKKNRFGQPRHADWNEHMINYLMVQNQPQKFGATLHLYQKDVTKEYDYAQIDRLRNSLPENTPISITEMGVLDQSISIDRHVQASIQHMDSVVSHLRKDDSLMDQVLYHNYSKEDRMANLHPRDGGISPKGNALIEYFNQLFD